MQHFIAVISALSPHGSTPISMACSTHDLLIHKDWLRVCGARNLTCNSLQKKTCYFCSPGFVPSNPLLGPQQGLVVVLSLAPLF